MQCNLEEMREHPDVVKLLHVCFDDGLSPHDSRHPCMGTTRHGESTRREGHGVIKGGEGYMGVKRRYIVEEGRGGQGV